MSVSPRLDIPRLLTRAMTRRTWLASQGFTMAGIAVHAGKRPRVIEIWASPVVARSRDAAGAAVRAARLDPAPWQALAQRAVDAARAAGASYADARLTRTVAHHFNCGALLDYYPELAGFFGTEDEVLGVGIRALVNGAWGFSASAVIASDEVVRVAQDAAAQARENASGTPIAVELGSIPVATGTWETLLRIDPFTVPIEEKLDYIAYCAHCAAREDIDFVRAPSWLRFVRHEQVYASSEGALTVQTRFESGGEFWYGIPDGQGNYKTMQQASGISPAGAGWERVIDARIPDQLPQIRTQMAARAALRTTPATVGRYTVVCDGTTMASVTRHTLGVATQLDRALGYEANAEGTSFVTDPLAMVGNFQMTTPLVTLTANRSAPSELATVKWDDDGVEPTPFTLVKDGVLVDFQTTREQAAWLASYYQKNGMPARSHGCAAALNAHFVTLQQMPNLALAPAPSTVHLEDLVSTVKSGVLIERGRVGQRDAQARTGVVTGDFREIKDGRPGKILRGLVMQFASPALWKSITAIGGPSTEAELGSSAFGDTNRVAVSEWEPKGEPAQTTSNTVRAVAALISDQALVDPAKRA